MLDLTLSPSQQAAVNMVQDWYQDWCNNPSQARQEFRLFGYAGTGKTTIIKEVIKQLDRPRTVYMAFTGKAASVMTQNGLPARTIHSTIYHPRLPSKEEVLKLQAELDAAVAREDKEEAARLKQVLFSANKVEYRLRDPDECDLAKAKLAVLDECSMVNTELARDLLSYGTPVLVIGDPGQLPPIDGTCKLVNGVPDITLTEIHRQAEQSPIISFATRARNGQPIALTDPDALGGTGLILPNDDRLNSYLLEYDQVLCGTHKTRRAVNRWYRSEKGYNDIFPEPGEHIICMKNDHSRGLLNGETFIVHERVQEMANYIEYRLAPDTNPDDPYEDVIPVHRGHFLSYLDPKASRPIDIPHWELHDGAAFDFAYAITVHKAQGSQWNNVVFYDDGFLRWNREDRRKLVYTAITRAADKLVIVSSFNAR